MIQKSHTGSLRESGLGLCNSLEWWDSDRARKFKRKGRDTGIPMADSCWCLAETFKKFSYRFFNPFLWPFVGALLVAQLVKNLPAMQETPV